MREVTLWGKWRGARPWALASLVCLAASSAWAAAEASYAGSIGAEFFGPFGFAAGSGNVSCVSGHCKLHCSVGKACTTDPPATGPSAPFGGAVLLDAAVDVVKTGRGFTADFHITSENNTGPNGSTQGLDWGSSGLTVEVYAPLAAGAQVLATTVYDLGSSWTNAEKGARVGLSFEERCRPGGASVNSAGSGSGSKSAADTVACVLAVDGTKTLATPAGTFRLVQRVTFGMSAGMRFNDQMTSGGRGSITFGFKAKGKELAAVGGPPEGLAGADPSFPRPFVVKVFQNDTVAAVAGEPVVFQLKDLAGNAVGAVPTATAGTLADGTAAVNFKVAEPGDYKLEAGCAGCVEGSPVLFTTKALSLNQAVELRKHSASNGGVVGERLRNPLVVKVINRVTNGPIRERSYGVNFELLPAPPCPAVTSIDPQTTSTLGEAATAQAHVKLGASTGNCRVRARCNECLAQPDVFFDLAIRPRPEFEMDGGEPGNPFSRSGGGPTSTTARRRNGQLAIQYKINPFGGFHRTIPASTESDGIGFIAALTGDTIDFLESTLGEPVSWKDSAGFSATGNFTSKTYSEAASDPDRPIIMAAQNAKEQESVRILVAQRPVGPTALALLEDPLHEVTVLKCFSFFPSENCIRALTSRDAADKFGNILFRERGRGPRGGNCGDDCCNAGMHAFWHATATSLTSADFAYEMGARHEREALHLGQEGHNAIVMDLHNNSLGQLLGRNTPESALVEKVRGAIENGQALVFDQPSDKLSLLVKSSVCGKR